MFRRTVRTLSDGREIIYFDREGSPARSSSATTICARALRSTLCRLLNSSPRNWTEHTAVLHSQNVTGGRLAARLVVRVSLLGECFNRLR